jgi:hypothetical protein
MVSPTASSTLFPFPIAEPFPLNQGKETKVSSFARLKCTRSLPRPCKIHLPLNNSSSKRKQASFCFRHSQQRVKAGKEGEQGMIHITGKEHIDLRGITKLAVSDITKVGDPANPQAYQRILVFMTKDAILELSIEAKEHNTICFAGDWMSVPDEKLQLDEDD